MRKFARRLSGIPANILPFSWIKNLAPHSPVFPFYHMVSDEPVPHVANLYPVTSVLRFEQDLDFLLRHYRPLRYSQVKEYASGHPDSGVKQGFFLSFDDGLREMAEIVAPILIKKGIEAAFFVNPAFIDNRKLFYRHKASLLAEKTGLPGSDTLAKRCASVLNCKPAQVKARILSLGQDDLLLDRLAGLSEVDFTFFLTAEKPYMEISHLRYLMENGFMIGAHGYDHTLFSGLNETGMKEQLNKSTEWLNRNLGVSELTFAFPFTDDGISSGFFRWMYDEAGISLSFGTAGLKHEKSGQHLQRIAMEKRNFRSAGQILGEEYGYYFLRSIFGKNKIAGR